jgi:hypothetical protein
MKTLQEFTTEELFQELFKRDLLFLVFSKEDIIIIVEEMGYDCPDRVFDLIFAEFVITFNPELGLSKGVIEMCAMNVLNYLEEVN